jgi:hypothetical protein
VPIQILAVVLGAIGLLIRALSHSSAAGLILPALILFLIIDFIGLVTGQLKLTWAAFLPAVPAFFVHPWYVGVVLGFVVIASLDVLATLLFGAMLLRRSR